MQSLPLIDIIIIILYLSGILWIGWYFSRKKKSSSQFTKASGKVPAWAVGLSIYATFLSSNTFIGVPGKAYGSDWNAFVFSLSLFPAAWIASRYFVPFYRKYGSISAYTHLEQRFGSWARTYAVICFLLTQLARMGSIFFGIGLTLKALTGYSMPAIMIVMGVCIIIYTVLGGMAAVIWTEVLQAVLITAGAILILYLVSSGMPEGMSDVIKTGIRENKFSLGSYAPDFSRSTFWVVLLYGFFINLSNFGVDQNYVQRYHTAESSSKAARSVWMSVWLYVPVSLLFFLIGTSLYAWYQVHPDMLRIVQEQHVREILPATASAEEITQMAEQLLPSDYGDKIVPHFMVTKIPAGLLGLVISAMLAAAMSTISSGMNASATVFAVDIYKKYFRPDAGDRSLLRVLKTVTIAAGILGIISGILMIGIKSVLDVWWQLAGIFSGGMLGLFLLGMISKKAGNTEAFIATIIGLLIILWMTFSPKLTGPLEKFKSPFHIQMVTVIGTLVIFLSGILLTRAKIRLGKNN